MDADTFAARLNSCAPSLNEALEMTEGRREAAEAIRDAYTCRRRPGMEIRVSDNPIIDLVRRYDLSSVEVGLVEFGSAIYELAGKLCFGKAEADPLVIDEDSGHVQLLDHASPGYVICECARNASQFLDALVAGTEILGGRRSEDIIEDFDVVNRCAELAGGDEYRVFYAQILGWGLDE